MVKPLQAHLTQEILYLLWDCGLKVGHSTRTVDEVFVRGEAGTSRRRPPSSSPASSPAPGAVRLVPPGLPEFLHHATTPKGYILARLEDQAQRRAKFGDTVFNQEPDIKNGVGGLRDYQNALWMARVKLGITTIDELAAAELPQARGGPRFQHAPTTSSCACATSCTS